MHQSIRYIPYLGLTGSMRPGCSFVEPPVGSAVVNPTISRNRGPDVWLTLAGWLWLAYFVGVVTGAIHWLLGSPH